MNFPCGVKVLNQPLAAFSNFPDYPTNIHPLVTFKNTSKEAATWIWNLDNRTDENVDRFDHEFTEVNQVYNVQLIVRSEDGCMDTVMKTLPFVMETTLYYPNSFSPNGDGDNDLFFVLSEGVQLKDFNLEIYNRWGEQVFRTVRQTQGWDGRNPGGALVPIGTYHFIMHYRDDENIERVIQDEINIAITGEVTGF